MRNIHNLPLPLFEAVRADPYDNGGADISVTSLLKPPQMWVLEQRHKEKVEDSQDISERLWSTYGQLMATLLERVVKVSPLLAARFQVEIRHTVEVEGWELSGAFDLWDRETKTLSDWKFVGAFAAKMAKQGDKEDWVRQTNMLRWLHWKVTGELAERLEIVCLLRDYSEKVEREGLLPCEVVEMPIWPLGDTEEWITKRIRLFQEELHRGDTELLACSDEDRWLRNGISKRCQRYCAAGKAGVCVQWATSI